MKDYKERIDHFNSSTILRFTGSEEYSKQVKDQEKFVEEQRLLIFCLIEFDCKRSTKKSV